MEKYASLHRHGKIGKKTMEKSFSEAMENSLDTFKSLLQVFPQATIVLIRFQHSSTWVYHSHLRSTLPQPLPPTLPHTAQSAHFTTAFTTGEGARRPHSAPAPRSSHERKKGFKIFFWKETRENLPVKQTPNSVSLRSVLPWSIKTDMLA